MSSLGCVERIDLLPHHQAARGKLDRLTGDYQLMQVPPPSAERMQAIAGKLQALGFLVTTGG